MKKVFILLLLVFGIHGQSFALITSETCTNAPCTLVDCTNPSTTATDGGGNSDQCLYSDSPQGSVPTGNNTTNPGPGRDHICRYIADGYTYGKLSVQNCKLTPNGAPINSALVFLIAAGFGVGIYALSRQQGFGRLTGK